MESNSTSSNGVNEEADNLTDQPWFQPKEKWNGWGPETKYYFTNHEGHISLSTTRATYPKLFPFIKNVLNGATFPKTPSIRQDQVKIPEIVENQPFFDALRKVLKPDQISFSDEDRLTHTFGKSIRDLIRLRRGNIARSPDVVLYPHNHDDVEKIMKAAVEHNAGLIPFGGGTNIVGAVEVPLGERERTIANVDLRKMNRVLSIDRESHTATIEAGALGPDLERQLGKEGFALGHDPDSFEYSTLGGWLATCSSGMQSDKYGDIEDMCVSLTLVTPKGTIRTPAVPRNGAGLQLKHLICGSEGVLGIITNTIMKIHKIPPARIFEGFLFPSFDKGVEAIHSLARSESLPSMVRLYDSDETRLSFSMKPKASVAVEMVSAAIKKYVQVVKSYDLDRICLMITGTEGDKSNVAFKRSRLYSILKQYGAFPVGQSAGLAWYTRRYDLPLMRDFLLDNGAWVDVCETSTSWPNVVPLWKGVKQAVHNVFARLKLPAWVGCHISHTYANGVCLYFHFASLLSDGGNNTDTLKNYTEVKKAATDAILFHHGALSHHHGVGYEHIPFMGKYFDSASLALLRDIKNSVDPSNVCNPGKLIPSLDAEARAKEAEKNGSNPNPQNTSTIDPAQLFYILGFENQSSYTSPSSLAPSTSSSSSAASSVLSAASTSSVLPKSRL